MTGQTPAPTGYVKVQIALDWSASGHYDARRELPCKHCGQPTNLRNDLGQPDHKVCVEAEIEAKVLAYAKSLLPVPAERPARRRPRVVQAVA
ncbi:hypothetical protein [Paractinoplanes atraurantiacus]|uniref:Uncharacterized protein n=1 Tax=Paractinoplanes atraurantiacus TaxID=1036182 RepID=A0A285KJK1_9ACTN|nr:hypothetical protein [Actinoplanes atraurantiacus]SNY72765.1 hypothetical protein SAMN05421748_1448 [Actinoplanes atraurantiacus]